jgi:hypothetical protein
METKSKDVDWCNISADARSTITQRDTAERVQDRGRDKTASMTTGYMQSAI